MATTSARTREVIAAALARIEAAAETADWERVAELALTELGALAGGPYADRLASLSALAREAAGAAESLRKRQERESAALAEIGRIIGSTLDINDVYERFAEQVRKLVPFDRIVITAIDFEKDTVWPLYVAGLEMPGPGVLEERPLSSTPFSPIIHNREPMVFDGVKTDAMLREYPGEKFGAMVGLRSLISVPLISNDRVLGFFSLRSVEEHAYGEEELRLVERVAAQISGAIANSQLYERTQRESRERDAIAAIGVAVNSEIELDTVYERMSDELRRLISYDWLSVVLHAADGKSELAFVRGAAPPGLGAGTAFVPERTSAVGCPDWWPFESEASESGVAEAPPTLSRAGLKSWISVCLGDPASPEGFLTVAAYAGGQYGRGEIELLKRVAAQVSPAIRNARLFRQTGEIAVLEERNRIARDIHDSMAQHIAAIVLAVNISRSRAAAGQAITGVQLDDIRDLADRALRDARRSVWDLRASPLLGKTLSESLRSMLDGLMTDGVRPDIEGRMAIAGDERTLPPGVEAACFRICQESLNNVLRHSEASSVAIELTFGPSDVQLTVSDDGVGFDPDGVGSPSESGGFGLIGMRERCRLLGGRLSVTSTPGGGAVVKAVIPT